VWIDDVHLTAGPITTVTNPPPPANHAPVARAVASPLFTVWPDQTNLLIIAVDGLAADVQLDGSLSSDQDNDALSFLWAKDEEGTPFASGAMTTNRLEVGLHAVSLIVNDGQATDAATLLVEVISLEDSLDELYGVLIESELGRKEKRPLLATLDRVWDSFDEGRMAVGARQLQAFQQKVRAQASHKHPDLALRLINVSEQIIDAVEAFLQQNPDRPHHTGGGKGDSRK
jgi:hypothetical protein